MQQCRMKAVRIETISQRKRIQIERQQTQGTNFSGPFSSIRLELWWKFRYTRRVIRFPSASCILFIKALLCQLCIHGASKTVRRKPPLSTKWPGLQRRKNGKIKITNTKKRQPIDTRLCEQRRENNFQHKNLVKTGKQTRALSICI